MNKETLAVEHVENVITDKGRFTFDDMMKSFLAGFDAAATKWIKVTPETRPEEASDLQFFCEGKVHAGYFKKHSPMYGADYFFTRYSAAPLADVSHYRYLDTTPPTE